MCADGPHAAQPHTVRSFISRFRSEILAEWKLLARSIPVATKLPSVALADHIPELLDQVAEIAEQLADDTLTPKRLETARRHGAARLGAGFDASAVVHELSILRGCMLAVWDREHRGEASDELRALNVAFDRAIAESVREVASERERALATLEALLAAAPVGIAFIDRDLRYLRVNDTLATMSGRPAADHIGRAVADVLPPHATAYLEPLLRRVLETGVPIMNREFRVEIPAGSGNVHGFLATYFPVRGSDATVTGVGGVVVETTAILAVQEQLRAAVRARNEVLAIVSHDLRNPLATIELSAANLRATSADAHGRKHLDMIQRSSARMEHLVDDLLDAAVIERKGLQLALERQPVSALVNEAVDLNEPSALDSEMTLRHDRVSEGNVECDRERLLQVFGNLVGNAIKFCRPGDTITIAARPDGAYTRFSVADTGPGIADEAVPHLFDPYWSAPEHARRGAGLGLYIARGIVEAHGGRIWVETGTGTTFSFTIPNAR
jgi:PAS domain S-box-containing protein